ncbi:MAG: sigma-54-dependent Fis family transcriptional regulator [Myxococcales bacterium]|nr:sigma-54-dependent Fis family transcriptional regulator [Myxococcales bacterium]
MRSLLAELERVADTDAIVTLNGETGTGKEVLARFVHERSTRRSAPFVPINCAAIPEQLFESELFGHERGAFTGATTRSIGKVEAAQHGTLFLDEIAELPLSQQAKLLRFLENRQFMRVGGVKKVAANVRVICATLRPLDEEVRARRFRADLYYRVQALTFSVPPLRMRREDIAPLTALLLEGLRAQHRLPPPRLTRAARAALLAYEWPGNVRELRNALERACLLRAGRPIRPVDLPIVVAPLLPATPAPIESHAPTLAAVIREAIESAIARNRTLAQAARELGVSERTLQRYTARGSVRRATNNRGTLARDDVEHAAVGAARAARDTAPHDSLVGGGQVHVHGRPRA